MAKLLVILLEHLRSILYESIIKIKNPGDLAEKPPHPTPLNRDNFFRLDLSIHAILSNFGFGWQKSPPKQGNFLDWIYPFHAI